MTPRPFVIAAGLAAMLAGCSPAGPAPASPASETAAAPAPGPDESAAPSPKPEAPTEKPAEVAKAPAAETPISDPAEASPATKPQGAAEVAGGEPAGEAIDPLVAVQADLQAGKFDDAIAKSEAILKSKPDDPRALYALALATQAKAGEMAKAKDRKASIPVFLKSAEAARKLRARKDLNPGLAPLIAQALYNEACSLAIEGKADAAMASLKEAFEAGFDDMGTFEKDEELDSLRKRPDFAALGKTIAEARAKLAEARAKAAVEQVAALFKENKPFPFTFSLPDVDGKAVSLDDLKGKVVIVDFWGTWCPPCRKEIPHFVDLYKTYHDKGLEIVGLNYNEDGSPEEVKKTIKTFLEENKVPYRCAVGDEKTQALVPDLEGYPTTLFLDRAGKVRLKLEGYTEKPVLEAIVKTLLDEK